MSLKVGIISQARMTSTRLPGKVMLRAGEKPLLQIHTYRLKQSLLPVFIATTSNKTDDIIADFCSRMGIPCFRGNETNVLSRYYECAIKFQLDIIIRVTSDCPLIDGKLIAEATDHYFSLKDKDIYLSSDEENFARGFDFEIFSFSLLEEAQKSAKKNYELEHVTPRIREIASSHSKVARYRGKSKDNMYRLTVDTPEDFQLIKILIEEFHADTASMSEIIAMMNSNPRLAEINRGIRQKEI